MENMYDVIIVGAGPAGLTAGMYTGRARLRTLIIEKEIIGGELMNREMIENYPGFQDGVLGSELGSNMIEQAMKYDVGIQLDEVERIDILKNQKLVKTAQEEYSCKAVIIAGGAHPRNWVFPAKKNLLIKAYSTVRHAMGRHSANKKWSLRAAAIRVLPKPCSSQIWFQKPSWLRSNRN